jgi:beta-N-acetylhexosaminidase
MKKMIRHLFYLIIIISFSLFPAFLTSTPQAESNSDVISFEQSGDHISVFQLTAEDELWIDSVLDKMTIRDRIAQMIMPWLGGNYSTENSADYKRTQYLIRDLKVGGFIIFKGDILSEAVMINRMQAIAETPLLISSDFERGLAMRLTDATEFPYNMALGAAGDPDLVRFMGKIVSLESRAIGVHQNYAPVADINNNADNPIINIRAYSEDKNVVAEYCEAFIRGSTQGRMITTVKHFPGHGNTKVDSHKDLPLIPGSRESLMQNEIEPFVYAINSGAHSVMIGHLYVPSLEPAKIPASLSKAIITDLLKDELGFKGLIVTDAMNMNAITKYFTTAQAAVMAVKAGNDIILMPPDEDIAVSAIAEAVYGGEILIERINESVRKILAAKKWVGIDKQKESNLADIPLQVGNRENIFLAKEIAEKSITLVKNDNNLIPVNPQKYYTTAVISFSDGKYQGSYFNELVSQEFGYIKTISLNRKSKDKDYKKAMVIVKASDIVLLPSYVKINASQGSLNMPDNHQKFINSVLKLNKPSIIISFGNPYLLSLFPQAATYLTAYGDAAVSQKAIIRAITGKADITGRLPISIPSTEYNRGSGLSVIHNLLVKDTDGYDFPQADRIIKQNISDRIYPGAAAAVISKGKLVFKKEYGRTDFDEKSPFINNDFIFDIDEITSLVTTAGALALISEGHIDLNSRVSIYVPGILDRNLLVKDILFKESEDHKFIPTQLAAARNTNRNNALVLQKVMEKAAGTNLSHILETRILSPLGMKRTMFNPPRELWFYTLPTSDELIPSKRNKGVVFDDEAFRTNGIAGHAGLFSSVEDIAVLTQMIIQKGKYADKQIITEEIFNSWYSGIENRLYATGKTGTALWIDVVKKTSVIYFTNSSYAEKVNELQNSHLDFIDSINKNIRY